MRRCDMTVFNIDLEKHDVEFDSQGRAYMLDGVNQLRVEQITEKLEAQDIKVETVSVAKWKELPSV